MTENKNIENRTPLTKKELNGIFRKFAFHYNRCGNFANWHGTTYGWSLIPMFKKYYGVGTKEFVEGVERHLDFHNNEPVTASIIQGIMVGMEEQKALGADVDPEMIRSTKASLMGPVAGIGDSLVQATLVPLLLSIGISLTGAEGNYSVLGPIFYLVSVAAILITYGYTLFTQGYRLGKDAINLLSGAAVRRVRDAIQIFGVILVGALSARYCAPKTILEFVGAPGAEATTIQSILDGSFPNLLGMILVLLCYWGMTKKKISPFTMILLVMAGTVVFTMLGII